MQYSTRRRLSLCFAAGLSLSALPGRATPPIPTSGVCATHTFRIKSGLHRDGRGTVGKEVSFEVLGYSHRPSGSVKIDFGDGTSEERGPWNFDSPLTVPHVYGRVDGFTAKLSGGRPPACGAGGQVSLGVIDQSMRSEVFDVTLAASKIRPDVPFAVRVAGNNGLGPCKVQITCGAERIELRGVPFPISAQCRPLTAGEYLIQARGLDDCDGYASARLVVAPLVTPQSTLNQTSKAHSAAAGAFSSPGTVSSKAGSSKAVSSSSVSSKAVSSPPAGSAAGDGATALKGPSLKDALATPAPPGRITGAAVNITSAGATIKIDGNGRCALNVIDKSYGGLPVWPRPAGAPPSYLGTLPARIEVQATVPGRDIVSIESAGGPEGCAGSATVSLR